MKKKKLFILFAAVVFIYSLWLAYHLLRFRTYGIDGAGLPPGEVVGAYHIHSSHSDGRKQVDEIARIASQEALDFIILTDHGHPNFESLACQGWKEGVLVLAGSEISSNRGHLVVLGFTESTQVFSGDAEEATAQVRSLGGFSVIAHPYSKTPWTWGTARGYGGIEIINADSALKKTLLSSLPYWPGLLIKPRFFMCKILSRPDKNLAKWDQLDQKSPVYGYYSVDAHFFYRTLFASIRVHIPLAKPLSQNFEDARQQIFSALKKGVFYSAIDGAAQANGFRFWAELPEKNIPMGRTAKIGAGAVLHAVSPPGIKHSFRILHNGRKLFQSDTDFVTLKVTQSGVYRIEVYLRERTPLSPDVPWILSNPIFLEENTDG